MMNDKQWYTTDIPALEHFGETKVKQCEPIAFVIAGRSLAAGKSRGALRLGSLVRPFLNSLQIDIKLCCFF